MSGWLGRITASTANYVGCRTCRRRNAAAYTAARPPASARRGRGIRHGLARRGRRGHGDGDSRRRQPAEPLTMGLGMSRRRRANSSCADWHALNAPRSLYPHSYPQSGRKPPDLAGTHRNNRSQSDSTGGSPRIRYAVPNSSLSTRSELTSGLFVAGFSGESVIGTLMRTLMAGPRCIWGGAGLVAEPQVRCRRLVLAHVRRIQ
jgi:hypothetical protein